MARSKRTIRKARTVSPQRRTSRSKPAPSTPWPTLEAFLDTEEGNITLGAINHSALGYTAIASDEHNMLIALVRQDGETLHQLLDRLERALAPAIDDQLFVDEING